jgi:hypothetical protein
VILIPLVLEVDGRLPSCRYHGVVDSATLVVIVAVILCGGGALAMVLRGRFDGSARVGGAELSVKAKREPKVQPGTATISGSSAGADASAIGAGGARIDNTTAGGSLLANADGPPDPKA